MNDYFLKANSESELYATLESASVVSSYLDESDPLNQNTENALDFVPTGAISYSVAPSFSLDVIGIIYKKTGAMVQQTLEDGTVIDVPEQIAIDGFHANLRGALSKDQAETLAPITTTKPHHPARVWA